jgi:hypothetical protein
MQTVSSRSSSTWASLRQRPGALLWLVSVLPHAIPVDGIRQDESKNFTHGHAIAAGDAVLQWKRKVDAVDDDPGKPVL